jgi:hypothetical protein
MPKYENLSSADQALRAKDGKSKVFISEKAANAMEIKKSAEKDAPRQTIKDRETRGDHCSCLRIIISRRSLSRVKHEAFGKTLSELRGRKTE